MASLIPNGPANSDLFKDVGMVSLAVVGSRPLLLGRDFILAKLLGPRGFGTWTQMVVCLNYALQLPLGFQHVLSREWPYYRAKEDWQQAKGVQDTTFVVMAGTALFAAVGLFLLERVWSVSPFGLAGLEVVAIACVIVVQQVYSFYSVLVRAQQKFTAFSVGWITSSVLSVIGTAVGALLGGASGAAVGHGVSYPVVAGYWHQRSGFSARNLSVLRSQCFRLLKVAIPLFLVGLSSLLITSVDRLGVALFYDKKEVGYYGFAFALSQSIHLVATPVVQAIGPRLMESLGKSVPQARLGEYLIVLTMWLGWAVALVVGAVLSVIGEAIGMLLPTFEPAMAMARLLLVGAAFASVAIGGNTFLVAVGKQNDVLGLQLAVIVFQTLGIGWILWQGGDTKWIAVVMATAYVMYAVLSVTLAGLFQYRSAWRGAMLAARISVGVGYVLLCAGVLSGWPVSEVLSPLFRVVARLVVWGALVSPVGVYAVWRLRRSRLL